MISNKYKCIFVHLKRTAGNSVELALGGIVLMDKKNHQVFEWDNELHRGKSKYKLDLRGHPLHYTAKQIKEKHPLEFDGYFKFSIVRNPWDQMQSLYQLRSQTENKSFLQRFIRQEPIDQKTAFKNWLKNQKYKDLLGIVPQYTLFNGEKCLVDFICRYEQLQSDFDLVCDKIGIKNKTLPKTNSSKFQKQENLFDDESVEIVQNIFSDDIKRFEYSFNKELL